MTTPWEPDPSAFGLRSRANTPPVIEPGALRPVLTGRYVWDYWPVRTRAGEVADLAGRVGWVALSVADDIEPEDRHFIASLRFASSAAGEAGWVDHGELFPDGAIGARQWAGSTVYDPDSGRLDVYYTACGVEGETEVTFEQRITHAAGRLAGEGASLTAGDWAAHRVILEGDGTAYAPTAGEKALPGRINAFRDPAFFRDPADGSEYLLFTATVPDSGSEFDGAVGIARSSAGGWELMPPLVTAVGVNKELERPHIVIGPSGGYYLFFTTHYWT
ncbi:MAG: glycoside hydrolase family 68 protein, partial [Actinobacteria bacterium]